MKSLPEAHRHVGEMYCLHPQVKKFHILLTYPNTTISHLALLYLRSSDMKDIRCSYGHVTTHICNKKTWYKNETYNYRTCHLQDIPH